MLLCSLKSFVRCIKVVVQDKTMPGKKTFTRVVPSRHQESSSGRGFCQKFGVYCVNQNQEDVGSTPWNGIGFGTFSSGWIQTEESLRVGRADT